MSTASSSFGHINTFFYLFWSFCTFLWCGIQHFLGVWYASTYNCCCYIFYTDETCLYCILVCLHHPFLMFCVAGEHASLVWLSSVAGHPQIHTWLPTCTIPDADAVVLSRGTWPFGFLCPSAVTGADQHWPWTAWRPLCLGADVLYFRKSFIIIIFVYLYSCYNY